MKKGLILIVLIMGMLCFAGCKGKDEILGESTLGNSTILANIENENITLEKMYGDEKYGYIDKTNYSEWTFYVKYAKEVLKANDNSGNKETPLFFKTTSPEDMAELIKLIDNYNENPNKIYNIDFINTKDDVAIFITYK